MSVNSKDLTGPALDWAVAQVIHAGLRYEYCEPVFDPKTERIYQTEGLQQIGVNFIPSTNWAQGGPIIERECIKLAAYEASSEVPKNPAYWEAVICTRWATYRQTGPTALIAAMRCYVSSVLGDEIEVPEKLMK